MTHTLDNIGTSMAPTWRVRRRAPFTVSAVRQELVHQAAQLPDWERDAYLSERLTDLDKALDADQAEALERWLYCEDLLQGRARASDYGDRVSSGRSASPVPDEDLDALAEHAWENNRLTEPQRNVLRDLGQMMGASEWSFGEPHMAMLFIARVRNAAFALTKMHRSVHSKMHSS